ncbi:MAG: response regulator transcription factor [Sulfitobacter sp.]|nr:response regulator transcription factor [Sulfitobacter sp.]
MTPHPQTPQTDSLGIKSVLIVDDHPLFCDALEMTMRSILPEAETILTTDRFEQAMTLLETRTPDVILLDLNLPDVEGMNGLNRLKRQHPTIPVVVVSSMADNRMISSCMGSGACGFIPKHADRAVFETAFRTLKDGGKFVPEGYVESEMAGETSELSDRLTSLTNQQGRILELICEGKLNKQIAFDLSIAETTVKAHVTAIMRKLGVQSRTQAVLAVQEANLAN